MALAIPEKTLVIRMVNSSVFLARLPSASQDHEPESEAGDRTVGRQGRSKRPGLPSGFWCEPRCPAALREPSREDPARRQWVAPDSSLGSDRTKSLHPDQRQMI